MRLSLVLAIVLLALGVGSISSAIAQDKCIIAKTPSEVTEALNSSFDNHRPTLLYVRADWAINAIFKNDTYVPSIAFLRTIGGINCVIADVTNFTSSSGNELIERFESDGIPFFTLLSAEGGKISTLRWGRNFAEFKSWLEPIKP
jgi:hypothetical protein